MCSGIEELVQRFKQHRAAYQAGTYNETQVRRDFIDPFFGALGWDVDNRSGLAESYRDVIHEFSLKVPSGTTAPDYLFRLNADPQFFVEAKKPSVNLRDSAGPASQLRRYAWSAKLPISILTDFEEFAVYDCRIEPHAQDDSAVARLLYLTFDAYSERWEELNALFGRAAVFAGSLTQYASTLPDRRGTREVDEAFLADIEAWRAGLAGSFAENNPTLSARQINYAVQQTIDRIVFLRISEAQGIEPYGQLRDLCHGDGVYERLAELFRRADQRYNSGLFHFERETRRLAAPDTLTLALVLDDATLRTIIARLYYPESQYAFNVIPLRILGQVYEQFLGRTIHLSPGGRATIHEKPEVKKAGGIYYTPAYVVAYIVDHALGPLLAGKTPRTASGIGGKQSAPLRILDPACGSGSFLIEVYDYLLRWHEAWYVANGPVRWSRSRPPRLRQVSPGTWHLTTAERKRILLTHVFGVDVDTHAVEVTKLSLLLKVLEHESSDTLGDQLRLFHARALPDLADNIKCGNSIIGPDFYSTQLAMKLDDEGIATVNPLDWTAAFPNVLPTPGFDAVIGNPPYRRELSYKHLMDQVAATPFGARFRAARMDLWYYFVHRALEVLRPAGTLAFIVNAYWTTGTGAGHLIAALRSQTHINEVFALGKRHVFSGVSGQHMILRVTNAPQDGETLVRVPGDTLHKSAEPYVRGRAPVVEYAKSPGQLYRGATIDLEPPADELLAVLDRHPALGSYGFVRQGIAENPASINRKTNATFGCRWTVGEGVFALTPREVEALNLDESERELLREYWDLVDIGRYWMAPSPSLRLIYSTRQTCPSIDVFPKLKAHLERFRPIMEKRRETVKGANCWWHLHWPREERLWTNPKVLSVQMAARPTFAADERGPMCPSV